MKKEIKGFIAGLLVSTVGLTSVFASVGIKSAQFNSNKVIFNGKTLDLSSQQMISVIKDGEENMSNYMPVRAVLEQMGYNVDWNSDTQSVIINSHDYIPPISTPNISSLKMYDKFPDVPDFGAFANVKVIASTESGYSYGFNATAEQIEKYYNKLMEIGFSFYTSFKNDDGIDVLIFQKDKTMVMVGVTESLGLSIIITN